MITSSCLLNVQSTTAAVTVVSAGIKGGKKAIRTKDVNTPTSRIGPHEAFLVC